MHAAPSHVFEGSIAREAHKIAQNIAEDTKYLTRVCGSYIECHAFFSSLQICSTTSRTVQVLTVVLAQIQCVSQCRGPVMHYIFGT